MRAFAFLVFLLSAAFVLALAPGSLTAEPAGASPGVHPRVRLLKERPLDAAAKAEILAQKAADIRAAGAGGGAEGLDDPAQMGAVPSTGPFADAEIVSLALSPGRTVEEALEGAGAAAHGAVAGEYFAEAGIYTVWVPSEAVDGLLARLEAAEAVVWAARSAERVLSVVPDDPYYERQWCLPALGFPAAWDITTGSPDVVIAVLDTGVAYEIPDLGAKIVHPYSVLWGTHYWPAWEDVTGHGSAVASIAAAAGNDGGGIAGAAWDVSVMPVHLSDGSRFSVEAEVAGILYAVEQGADVINISAGAPDPHPAEEAAIEYALQQGVIVVAAAGNTGSADGTVQYPAAYPGVIGVGASGREPVRADFSARGAGLDLLASGVEVPAWTADSETIGLTNAHSGTSFAAPFVSGLAALVRSLDPSLSPHEVETLLRAAARDPIPGWDRETGYGVIDAGATLERAAAGAPVPVPFSDVSRNHPYANAIGGLYEAGVIVGFGDGSFRPEGRVSRQQFAKMILLTLEQVPTEWEVSVFADVPPAPGLYPDNFVALAYRLGITKGTSVNPALFSPHAPITRAQVITMVTRAADALYPGALEHAPGDYRSPFGSFSRDHDSAAQRAYWNGLLDGLQGMGSDYDFWRAAERGEVAQMLFGLLVEKGEGRP
ncbi:MAG: hypothetical protein Kow00129_06810 [Thermoleophilia bacterium]